MYSTRKMTVLLGLFLVLILFLPGKTVFAQGFIIPRPIPDFRHTLPELTQHRVDVEIVDQVARVQVHQVFHNHSNRPLEGTYYFPLPKEASISDFKMVVDGKVLSGELLEKDKARKIYEDIVRRQIDPALLEYIDHNLFSARIFPIPPHKERKIVLEYTSLLKRDGDLIQLSYPLRGRIASERLRRLPVIRPSDESQPQRDENGADGRSAIDQVIEVELRSKIPLKNLYSPSHDVDISRIDDHHARLGYEGKRKNTSDTFVLYYSYSQSDFGLNLLATRPEQNENGFFMLLVSPKTEYAGNEIIDKDIIFILDTSGSMEGEKIAQAKDALTYCINRLHGEDRFNLITFSTESRLFKERLVPASEYRRDALSYVEAISAKGGTNINDALNDALTMETHEDRPVSIVFLTDGLPTAGVTDVGQILKNVSKANKNRVKIFTFGVGYDVNTMLLDKIAAGSRSVSDYIEPNENIEEKISGFYDKISHPVLTDLTIDYDGVDVEDVCPKTLPDLFKGSQLTIFGRFSQEKNVEVTLRGRVANQEKAYTYTADFSADGDDYVFLPHLWATRRIGTLMDEIRLHGENQELVDEIVRLSKKYGVMSPYTSYLVQEEDFLADGNPQTLPGMMPAPASGRGNTAFESAGAGKKAESIVVSAPMDKGTHAVRLSKRSREMKEASAVADEATVRYVGARTFYLRDGFWMDGEYTDEKTLDIKYASQAYVNLMLTFPDAAKFCALGETVIFKYKGVFVKISDKGREDIAEKELKRLLG